MKIVCSYAERLWLILFSAHTFSYGFYVVPKDGAPIFTACDALPPQLPLTSQGLPMIYN